MNSFKLSMTALLALGMTASMCAQNGQSKKSLKVLGTTRIGNAKKVASESGNEVMTGPEVDVSTAKPQISGTTSPARVPSAHVPNPTGDALVTAAGSNFVGFNGLTHRDQRLSNNGNQFSLEPPDQGLAVSGGFVVEAVNDAVAVYDRSGNLLKGPVSLNEFFNLPPAINRTTTPPTFGPDPTDPRVYYDTATGRFFLVSLVLGLDQQEKFVPPAVQYIAVSQTSDPAGLWTILALDVTDDGGPFSPCPCFGDQPLIGADANGFYISDNAYNIVARSFAGANMYAMSKAALELATPGNVTAMRFGPLTEAGFPFAFSVQPATTAPGADNPAAPSFSSVRLISPAPWTTAWLSGP